MTYTVSKLSLACMVVAMVMGVVIPAVLYRHFRKKRGCDHRPFWVGCIVMLLFAFVLESLVHRLVLSAPVGTVIQGKLWLYALYGGFMAGLFEETGRFLAFRTVLRGSRDKDQNALMYGAGHGGFEAFFLLTFGMLNNLVTAVLMNTGHIQLITGALSGTELETAQAAMAALASTPSWLFLVSVLERGSAVIAHLSLSVLVWFAATRQGRLWLYPLAIALHMLLDAVVIGINGMGVPVMLQELIAYIFAAAYAVFAWGLWRKENGNKP